MKWITTWSLVTLTLELNHFLFSNMASFFLESRTSPDAPIGLWTLSPLFSAVLPHPAPTIPFSDWSAVSHPKTRDFRFQSLPVMSFPVTSGSGHVTSGHMKTRPHPNEVTTSKRGQVCYVSPTYYYHKMHDKRLRI